MANSHPGSYCGQDAYNDMLVTESKNGNNQHRGISLHNGHRESTATQGEGLQRCPQDFRGGVVFIAKYAIFWRKIHNFAF